MGCSKFPIIIFVHLIICFRGLFSEPDHIEHILKTSGFKNVVVKTLKTKMINYDRIDNQIQLFNKIGLAARIKKEASFDEV